MNPALGALLLLALPGAAGRPLDHQGSLGLVAAVGAEYASLVLADCVGCPATGLVADTALALEVGGTAAVGDAGSEFGLRLRLSRLSEASGESVLLGYRRYSGPDEWKTFFAFDLVGTFRPSKTLGARAGLGVLHDFTPLFGLYADAGVGFGLGAGRRFSVDLLVGLQARSYLLE